MPVVRGVLARWGNAAERRLRLLDGPDVRFCPRRARCRGCGGTHVLLPAWCLARRADAGEVIGLALEAKACGDGHRMIAGRLGRPASTVRGWLRAFASAGGAGPVGVHRAVAQPGHRPAAAGPGRVPAADAVAAVAAAAVAASRVPGVGAVARWQLAAAVTSGLLLAPAWAGRGGQNTSWLWAAPA